MKTILIMILISLVGCKGEGSSNSISESDNSQTEVFDYDNLHLANGTYQLECTLQDNFFNINGYVTATLTVDGLNWEIHMIEYNHMDCAVKKAEFRYTGSYEYIIREDAEEANGYDIRVVFGIDTVHVKDLTVVANRFNPCGGNYTDNDWHEITNAGCEQDISNQTGKVWKLTYYDNGDFDTYGLQNASMENFNFIRQ